MQFGGGSKLGTMLDVPETKRHQIILLNVDLETLLAFFAFVTTVRTVSKIDCDLVHLHAPYCQNKNWNVPSDWEWISYEQTFCVFSCMRGSLQLYLPTTFDFSGLCISLYCCATGEAWTMQRTADCHCKLFGKLELPRPQSWRLSASPVEQ